MWPSKGMQYCIHITCIRGLWDGNAVPRWAFRSWDHSMFQSQRFQRSVHLLELIQESADKSNKDMLTDHYYRQVKAVIFCEYLWGREASGDITALGAVVWKSDTCLWPGHHGLLCFWNQSPQDLELWQKSSWSGSLFKCTCPGPALCRIPSPGAQVSQMCRTPS